MKWLTNMHESEIEGSPINEQWLAGKVIGRPKASDVYTIEQLEAMGMVGVYSQEEHDKNTLQ